MALRMLSEKVRSAPVANGHVSGPVIGFNLSEAFSRPKVQTLLSASLYTAGPL